MYILVLGLELCYDHCFIHRQNVILVQKPRFTLDCCHGSLQTHFDYVFQIHMLPGIEYSKEQQLQHLEALRTQLRLKQELLHKYRYLYPFETQKS